MAHDLAADLANRQSRTPSSAQVVAAFSPSDQLDIFYVGNKNSDCLYILAKSRKDATIIAMMGGHIRELRNARFWKPLIAKGPGTAVYKAIKAGIPGSLWIRERAVITQSTVFIDD
jgi:hypothetical protein